MSAHGWTMLAPVVLGLTSLAILVLVARRRGVAGLGAALGTMLEVAGATVLLFLANVALGAVVVLVARRLTPFYGTLYAVNDISLLVVSLLQALTITLWRTRAR